MKPTNQDQVTKLNQLTLTQKGSDCRPIEISWFRRESEITPEMVRIAEATLQARDNHQAGYYDLLLENREGKELDFETNIVS